MRDSLGATHMQPRRTWVMTGIAISLALVACGSSSADHPDIPAPGAFERTLQHDLDTYFAAGESVPIHVTYELLQDQPTITRIAYPKYYLWVTVRSQQSVLRVGAARVAAINKTFEITSFVSAEYLIEHPEYTATVFPAALVGEIQNRGRNALPVPKRGA
jgi:hypothetical protein